MSEYELGDEGDLMFEFMNHMMSMALGFVDVMRTYIITMIGVCIMDTYNDIILFLDIHFSSPVFSRTCW